MADLSEEKENFYISLTFFMVQQLQTGCSFIFSAGCP
jgi:hypothetical protein